MVVVAGNIGGGPLNALALAAQEVKREVQVPIDPALGLLEITPDVRSRLGLFPDADGFVVARLFEDEAGLRILEITTRRDGRLHLERRPLSPAEVTAFRDDFARRSTAEGVPADQVVLVREGRGGLVLRQTLLGVAFYGWAVPVILDVETARGATAAYLLTAGTSFYLPYRLTRGRPVTEAQRNLALYGGTRGIAAGALVGDVLATDGSENEGRVQLTGALLGSVAGSVAGYMGGGASHVDPGRAALVGLMGDAGMLGGAGSAVVAGFYGSDEVMDADGTFRREGNVKLGHAVTLAGAGAGLLLGRRLAAGPPTTQGNVTALRSTGVLGAQLLLPLAHLARDPERDNGRVLAAGAVLGGAGGLYVGHRMLADERLSQGDGLLLWAGHLAGGATALGATFLLDSEGRRNERLYLATTAAGSLAGFALTYRALDRRAGDPSREAASGEPRSGREPGVRVTLHPEGVLLPLLSRSGAGGGSEGVSGPAASVPRGGTVSAPLFTIRF